MARNTGRDSDRIDTRNSERSRTTPTTGAPANRNANANTSVERSDRERDVQTSRETTGPRDIARAQRGLVQWPGLFGGPLPGLGGAFSPFALMRRVMEDMDRFVSEPGARRGLFGEGGWSPAVEVFERGNELVVRADLPGLSKNDVTAEVHDDTLILRGERRSEREEEHGGVYRSERSYGSFYRAIPLPDEVDPSATKASFKDGVLEVTLPKPKDFASRRRRIEIR